MYKIKRWDARLTSVENNINPMVYIEIDDLLEDINILTGKIINTNSIYDNIEFKATLKPTSLIQGPNFFKKNGLYVLILDTDWEGYPPQKGYFKVIFKESEKLNDEKKNMKIIKNNKPPHNLSPPPLNNLNQDSQKKLVVII